MRKSTLLLLLPVWSIIFLGLSSCSQNEAFDRIVDLEKEYQANTTSIKAGQRLDSAIKRYILANPKDFRMPDLLFTSGKIHHITLNNPDQALVQFAEVFKLFPQHPRAPEAMSIAAHIVHDNLKKPKEAAGLFATLAQKYPDTQWGKDAAILKDMGAKSDAELLDSILKEKAKKDSLMLDSNAKSNAKPSAKPATTTPASN